VLPHFHKNIVVNFFCCQ